MASKKPSSTRTPASQPEEQPAQPPAQIVRTTPLAAAAQPPAEAPPARTADVLNVSRLLCPACRCSLTTYGTARRGSIIVRYHRCGHCGATGLRTHETADGRITFAGWADRQLPQFSRN